MHLGSEMNECFALSVVALKDYIYYLYFEHRCSNGKPRTDKMCVFYHKEGGKFLHFMIYSSLGVDLDYSSEAKP